MNEYVAFALDLVKIVAPALLVYLTARTLIVRHLGALERVEAGRRAGAIAAEVLPARLQAYERLTLFCERIALPSLLFRLQEPGQSAGALRLSLYLAIRQEYEHNLSQQVYLSPALWAVIRQARDNTLVAIATVADGVGEERPGPELAQALLAGASDGADAGLAIALAAIKKEVGLLYG